MGFAFSDILFLFSTFEKNTAHLIGWLLASLASILGVVKGIAVWLGLTAGLGAVGIGIVLVNAVLIFVLMNIFIGNRAVSSMKNARDLSEIGNKANSTMKTFAGARATAEAIIKGNEEGAKAAGKNPK